MSRKVAVVTGANKGIGYAIVRALCKEFGGTVILTARDEGRGLAAVESLKKEGLDPQFLQLDIDSLESIQKFRKSLKEKYGGLDVLVNNAAIAFNDLATEPYSEQAEVTTRVNFFGTLNVCRALFPLLKRNAKVVNLSSACGHLSYIDGKEPQSSELRKILSDPNLTIDKLVELANSFVNLAKEGRHHQQGWSNCPYTVSKVCVSALTRIYQREMDESRPTDNILVNSVYPGYVDTDMTSHMGELTIDQGAEAPVWLALLPEFVSEPRGGFVWHDKQVVDWINGPLPSAY